MTNNNIAQTWKELQYKDKAAYILAFTAFILGWVITIAGFCVPPLGIVHETVLWILGQALLFSGSVIGIAQYYSAQLKAFKDNIGNTIEQHIKLHEDQKLEQ